MVTVQTGGSPRIEAFKLLTLQTFRRSGEPYRVPLWFRWSEGKLLIVSSMGRESWWVRHILRDSRVEGVVGRGSLRYWFQGHGEVVEDPPLLRETAREIYRKHYGWEDPAAIRDWYRGACLVIVRPLLWLKEEVPEGRLGEGPRGHSRRKGLEAS